jgi:allantoin racemase
VACFSAHPLTPALRELTDGPVMSILEAPLLYAQTLGSRVGILTTAALHLSAQNAAGVVSSGLSVLDLEDLPRDKVVQRLCDVAREELQDRRGADVIVLGCAGMVGLDVAVRDACQRGMVVLDPVRCALEMCISLIRMDIKTSKIGIYAPA